MSTPLHNTRAALLPAHSISHGRQILATRRDAARHTATHTTPVTVIAALQDNSFRTAFIAFWVLFALIVSLCVYLHINITDLPTNLG